ncbi:hypothetical protein C6V05_02520 [Burkholderia multivorans]|nr:hypothetical protein C6V05_02520 [Burkholderia multivorans]
MRAAPRIRSTGASAPVFFVSPRFSRYEKIFCLVKNHAAWHNRADCRIKKGVSHHETSIINT